MKQRYGFSLIELITVLAIVSLITVAVGVRWSGPYKAATFQSSLERIADLDFKSRKHAIGMQLDGNLAFDLERNQMAATRWANGAKTRLGFKLSGGVELQKVMTVDGPFTAGTVELGISRQGAVPSYAVSITQGKKERWLFFSGRTGQSETYTKEEDVKSLFKSLQVQGADAD